MSTFSFFRKSICLLLVFSCFSLGIAQKKRQTTSKRKVENQQAYKELKAKLRLSKITIDFQDAPLFEVFDFIREVSGCNIVLDGALTGPEFEDVSVTIKLTDLPVQNCINLLCSLYKLRAVYTSGVLYIAPVGSIKEKIYLKVYDTRDLVFNIKDFPGPKLSLTSKEKDDGTVGVLFTEPKEPDAFNDSDKLLELIRDTVTNDWEQEGHSISSHGNKIIALTTKSVHKQIHYLIGKLRQHK